MNKTITIDPDTGSVMVEQRDITEGVGVSSDGFKINTGMGWGIDIAIVIAALAILYSLLMICGCYGQPSSWGELLYGRSKNEI